MKNKITILLADDNADFTNNLTEYIEAQDDMEVIGVARDGKEAIEMIKNINPDLVLLDVIMPHLDGLRSIRRVK